MIISILVTLRLKSGITPLSFGTRASVLLILRIGPFHLTAAGNLPETYFDIVDQPHLTSVSDMSTLVLVSRQETSLILQSNKDCQMTSEVSAR